MRLVSYLVNFIFILATFCGLSLAQLAHATEPDVETPDATEDIEPKKSFEVEFCMNLTLLTSLEMDPHVKDDYVHFSPGICAELVWNDANVIVIGAAVTLEEKPIPMPYFEYEHRSKEKHWFLLTEFRSAYDLAKEGLSLNGALVAGWQHDIIELGAGASTWRVGEEQAIGPMVYLRASPRKSIEMRFYAAPGVTISEAPMFHMMGGASVSVKIGKRHHKS